MAEVKWIKIVTDVFDDEKILLIESLPESDSIIVIWFKLLCLAGKQNNSGVFLMNNRIPYTEEMLAAIFRRPLNTVKLALKTFENFGMVEIVDGVITIPNWEKHQSLDKLEMVREQTRKRVAKYRERQKQKALRLPETIEKEGNTENVTRTVTLRNALRNSDVTQTDIDKDIDIDIDKERKKERKKETFDELINSYTDNEELREELKNHLATRKSKKATLTNRAIELSLKKLDQLVYKVPINQQEETKLKIVQQSIENGWVGFFELKENNYTATRNNKQQSGNMFFDLLREEGKME